MSLTVSASDAREGGPSTVGRDGAIELIVDVAERGYVGRNPYEALFRLVEPILSSIGSIRRIDRPETRLAFAARKAEERGNRPIHLAFAPPHEAYLTPAVATALIPLWAHPDIPDRDLGRNGRHNWRRVLSRVDALFATSRSAAAAFGAEAATLLPVPIPDVYGTVPPWNPARITTFVCRHHAWGGPPPPPVEAPHEPEQEPAAEPAPPPASAVPAPKYQVKAKLKSIPGRARRVAAQSVKRSYHRLIRRWLSDEAHERLKGLKRAVVRRPAPPVPPPAVPEAPVPVPPGTLALTGLVFLAEVDFQDPGLNDLDLLTAYLMAFRTRTDVTLVVVLRTDAEREPHDLWRISHHYETLKIKHQCRLVIVGEPLCDAALAKLTAGIAFVVDTRRSAREAWFAGHALAAGRPVIAPTHTALGDWVDAEVGLPVRSAEEPESWPQNPEGSRDSVVHRLDWADLRNRLLEAASLAPAEYRAKSDAARAKAAPALDPARVREAWENALAQIETRPSSTLDWEVGGGPA